MKKIISVFASALLVTSLFVATASAIENNQMLYQSLINNAELQKCFESGRDGCR